ncbi:MAG: thioredoxin [Bacteroidota bacterium]|jgi:thioredoxin
MNKVYILLTALVMASVACTKSGGQTTNAQQFEELLKAPSEKVLLDVRTPEEFALNHIPGANNLNVNASDFEEQIKTLDKSTEVFVYCKSGSRSSDAKKKLEKLGFARVYDLEGGILAWQSQGKPVEVSPSQKSTNGYTMDAYNAVIDSNALVLVDFYADWCGPCKMMAPHVKTMKEKYGDKLTVLKVDTDRSPAVSQHFNITGIPLVKVYANGKEVYDKVGYHSAEELDAVLTKHL